MIENETSDDSVWFVREHAGRRRVSFHAYDISGRGDEPGSDLCHVAHPEADLENSLRGTDAGVLKEPLGQWSQSRGVPCQPALFSSSVAQPILGADGHGWVHGRTIPVGVPMEKMK